MSRLGLSSALLVLALAGVAAAGAAAIEWATKSTLQDHLETILETNQIALETWAASQERSVEEYASRPEVVERVAEQMRLAQTPGITSEDLRRSTSLRELRRVLRPHTEFQGYVGFVILDRDGRNIGALLDRPIGHRIQEESGFVERAWRGESVLSHPFPAEVPLPNEHGVEEEHSMTMFAAAPVVDPSGEVIAVLGFRLRPVPAFSRILMAGRFGETGETYAFDADGRMLSSSRFRRHLEEAGLAHEGRRMELRDPGVNLLEERVEVSSRREPLTRAVAAALAGGRGADVDGYRDYRGVEVVGAWAWLPEYGFGVATEADLEEAYHAVTVARRTLIALLLLLVGASVVAHYSLRRSARRGAALMDSEEKYRLLSTSSPIGVFQTDAEGVLSYVNERWAGICGAAIGVGSPWTDAVDTADRGRVIEDWDRARSAGDPLTVRCRLADAPVRWVKINLRAVDGASGHVGSLEDVTRAKRQEERLRERRMFIELLQVVATAANDAHDVDEAILVALSAVGTLTGWPLGHAHVVNDEGDLLSPTGLWHIEANDGRFDTFVERSEQTTFALGEGLPGRVLARAEPAWIADVKLDRNFPRSQADELPIRGAFGFPVLVDGEVAMVLEFFSEDEVPRAEALVEVMDHVGRLLGRVIERKRGVAKLERLHAELVETSRHAGMAEVATDVLHNVGNVLNSVNVGIHHALSLARTIDGENLSKAAQLLTDGLVDEPASDPKLGKVAQYVSGYASALSERQSEIAVELQGVIENVNHISVVVSSQQRFAKVAGLTEVFAVGDAVDQALGINRAALDHAGVRVERRHDSPIEIESDRQKALQILVNLISNATHAMKASSGARVLTIEARTSGETMSVEVTDTGAGIAEANLLRIFEHGFTTRPDGHGFGLHASVLAAVALGGTLEARSDGEGEGASFTLSLPIGGARLLKKTG